MATLGSGRNPADLIFKTRCIDGRAGETTGASG